MSDGWDRSTADMPAGSVWRTSGSVENPDAAIPTRLGRYIVVNPIASGGMGTVYAGHDPDLDRRVALKIVHPSRHNSPGAQSRLIKEARALAKLDHPNVIKVHDVFVDDGTVVIVMELATGETLATWEQSGSRSRQEIIDAYAQAAMGLASAHALEIVHRDFKPQNVVVDSDGRVRVLDFGLAHIDTDECHEAGVTSGSLTQTVPGAIMGTIAYSAPEQLRGEVATALSDQFSFCVSLHRALEAVAPFAGTTATELLKNIDVAAPTVAKDRLVPAWLRELTARGLAKNPGDRHPSMSAIAKVLTRARGWRRWRVPLLVAALMMVGSGASFALTTRERLAPCSDGSTDLARIWNPTIRASVVRMLEKSGTPYAREVAAQVATTIERRTKAWSETFHAVCDAHRQGAISDVMFDHGSICLQRSLEDTRASLASLPSASTLANAVVVIAGIADPSLCGDVTRLGDDSTEPTALDVRVKVVAVRNLLSEAAAARRAGDLISARSAANSAVVMADQTKFKTVLAEAQLEQGRVALASPTMTDDDVSRGAAHLQKAMETALEINSTAIAVEAAARRIYIDVQDGKPLSWTLRDYDTIAALSRSLGPANFARLLLLNNAAVAYRGHGQPTEAAKLLREAHRALAGESHPDIELSCIDINLAAVDEDPDRREAIGKAVVDTLTRDLGHQHPTTLSARLQLTMNGVRRDDTGRTLSETCRDINTHHPELPDFFYECLHYELPFLMMSGNERAERDVLIRLSGDAVYEGLRRRARAQLAVLDHDNDFAKAELERLVRESASHDEWWMQQPGWEAELALGRALTREHRFRDARSHLVSARDGFKKAVALSHIIAYAVWLEESEGLLEIGAHK